MALKRTLLIYAAAIVAIVSIGSIGSYILGNSNFNVPVNTPEDALYFTISTLSTVGYGDIYPTTPLGRGFVIVLIVVGLGIFLGAISELAGEFLNSRIDKKYNRVTFMERVLMNNHIVLIGVDSTNTELMELLGKKDKVVVITRNKEAIDEMRAKGIAAYYVDPSLSSEMKQFNLSKAKDIVIDLTNKERTVYAVLVVRKLAPKVPTAVVASTPDLEAHLIDLGVKNVINPTKMAAKALKESMKR